MFFERPLIVRFLSRLQRPLVGAEELRRSWRCGCGAAKQQLVLERLPLLRPPSCSWQSVGDRRS